jgi:hypothetical protein
MTGKKFFGDGTALTGVDGGVLSGGNLNYSSGITINSELDSKQNTLTFGKSIGNSLKLEENININDILLVGVDNVIGKTYVELKTLLSLNDVDNTSDVNKPVSTATTTQLASKANLDSPTFTGPLSTTGIIKSDNSFKLNSHKVLFNSGLDEGTNPYLNARVLQNTSSLYNDGMYINYQSSGTSTLRFYAGTSTPEVPKMMIFSNGNVGINTTGPGEKLSVDGNIVCNAIVSKSSNTTAESLSQNSGHGSGTLSFGTGTTSTDKFDVYFYIKSRVTNQNVYGSFSATEFGSDDRRKHNEVPIKNALDSIMKLQCQTYDKTFIMKDENWNGKLEDEAHWKEAGLIAQDVYQIPEFREYVKVGSETISWDINYKCLFTYNIRATQELKIENDELKNKVFDLEKNNEILVNKMSQMELKISLIFKQLNL